MLDTITADDAGYVVGDKVKVNAEGGSREFTLVGIAVYDNIVSPGNATWALFDAPTAEEFVAKPGFVDAVLVKGDGSVTDDVLVERIQSALDPNIAETLTSAEITEQTQTDIERSLGFITLFLAIFSFIALGVGMFVIYNVFSITAAQRQRENALLRAIGASRRQVTWTLLIESAVVGLFGSIAGLFGGIGLALGIRNLLDALDYSIPARGLALEPFTVALTIIAGTAASLIAAIAPAIGAGRVPPVAAMADTAFERTGSVRGRVIGAAACALIGGGTIVAVLLGADGDPAGRRHRGAVRRGAAARSGDGPPDRSAARRAGAALARRHRRDGSRQRAAQPEAHGAHRGTGADRRRAGHRRVGVRRVDQGAVPRHDRLDVRRRLRDQLQQRWLVELQPDVHRRAQHAARGRCRDRVSGSFRSPTPTGERGRWRNDQPADRRRACCSSSSCKARSTR